MRNTRIARSVRSLSVVLLGAFAPRRASTRNVPVVETCEPRKHLSSAPTSSGPDLVKFGVTEHGVAIVGGTTNDERLAFRIMTSKGKGDEGPPSLNLAVQVNVIGMKKNSQLIEFPIDGIHQLDIHAGAGKDYFEIRSVQVEELEPVFSRRAITVNMDEGNDRVQTWEEIGEITGGPGNDILYGNWGRNVLNGSTGIDSIYAGDGDDWIIDGELIYAGKGNDVIGFYSFDTDRTIVGGDGYDFVWAFAEDNPASIAQASYALDHYWYSGIEDTTVYIGGLG